MSPAPTVAVRPMGSTSSIAVMRSSEMTTSPGPVVAPATTPVRPPWVTTVWPRASHSARTLPTSPASRGRTSAAARIGAGSQ